MPHVQWHKYVSQFQTEHNHIKMKTEILYRYNLCIFCQIKPCRLDSYTTILLLSLTTICYVGTI